MSTVANGTIVRDTQNALVLTTPGVIYAPVDNILRPYVGKTVRVTIDEVTEFSIQRDGVKYSIRIFPEKFEVVRAEGEVSTMRTFLTDEIGPEYVAPRQYKSAMDTVLKMLDGIDKKC